VVQREGVWMAARRPIRGIVLFRFVLTVVTHRVAPIRRTFTRWMCKRASRAHAALISSLVSGGSGIRCGPLCVATKGAGLMRQMANAERRQTHRHVRPRFRFPPMTSRRDSSCRTMNERVMNK
jgi:hypothetical protein